MLSSRFPEDTGTLGQKRVEEIGDAVGAGWGGGGRLFRVW